jgi:predicted GNAT family N-acyltransferase
MSTRLIESLTPSQVRELHHLYQQEWWTQERSFEDVQTVVQNSSLIVACEDADGSLIAFCRLLTDFVFRGTIYDVIVSEPWRGRGLGRQLMDAVCQHRRLKRVSVLWLCCRPELAGFYEKWGFQVYNEGPHWMLKPQRPG